MSQGRELAKGFDSTFLVLKDSSRHNINSRRLVYDQFSIFSSRFSLIPSFQGAGLASTNR
jgi:hypothetical protein